MLKHQLISQILISTQIMLTRTMKPFFNDFENVSKHRQAFRSTLVNTMTTFLENT